MPYSTIGPMFSRIVYGRGLRSYRLPCFIAAIMLLPICLLFYYAITEPLPTGSFGELNNKNFGGDGGSANQAGDDQIVAKRPLPSRDAILDRLVMSKSVRANGAIPDTRPNDCIASSSEDSPPALEQIREKMPSIRTTIILFPDQKHAQLPDYELTLASILSTTEAFYERLEIVLVINEFLTNDVVKYLEQVKDSKMPVFYMVKPKKTRRTLFHELLELGKQQLRGDVLIYLASGVECNVGWLEAMIMPLMKQPSHTTSPKEPKSATSKGALAHDLIKQLQPVIVTPHFDRLRKLEDNELRYDPENEFVRLLFHWNLKPMWYEMSFEELLHRNSEAEEIGTPAFLTHAFAVNKSSPLYVKLFSHFEKRVNDDTTTFEAAQLIWRCLNGAIVIAPCARIGSPNVYLQNEFDPRIITNKDDEKEMKKRIVETWFEDYRPLALRLISNSNAATDGGKIEGEINSDSMPPDSCNRSFYWYLENIAKEVVVPEEHIAFGWLKSGGGACFRAAIEHRLLGGSCTVLSDAHIFFLEKDGAIRTRTGLCVSAPETLSYIELVECDPKDAKQRWIYSGDGTIRSSKNRCMMHATDPDEEKKARQILMLYNCTENDNKQYALFQKFSFTYKIV